MSLKKEIEFMIGKATKEDALIEEALNEGLMFFKTSKKLDRIIKIIETRSKVRYSEIKPITDKLRKLEKIFEEIEFQYRMADSKKNKEKIKNKYKELKEKYKLMLSFLTKEDVIHLLKKIGVGAVVIGSLFLVLKGIYDYQVDVERNTVEIPFKGLKKEKNGYTLTDSMYKISNTANIEPMVDRLIAPAASISILGLGTLFSKIFKNKGDELYRKTRNIIAEMEAQEKPNESDENIK